MPFAGDSEAPKELRTMAVEPERKEKRRKVPRKEVVGDLGKSWGFSGHHGEFNGRCNGIIWESYGNHMGKWDIMGITKLKWTMLAP